MDSPTSKPLFFLGSSDKDLRVFPEDVKREIGYALFRVQLGETPRTAKPLKGYGGATVLEIVADFDTDTYRAVYTVRFANVVYVLHAFQKKSRQGIATSQMDLNLIKRRLLAAQAHYRNLQDTRQKGD